ncbi:MAG TPA: hypothetical protein VIM57_08585 [Luteolibacter sp.]
MKKTTQFAMLGVVFGLGAATPAMAELVPATATARSSSEAEKADQLAAEVKNKVQAAPSEVLSIVKSYVAANPAQAGDVVKAAIEASKADSSKVLEIVTVAIQTAPDQAAVIAHYAAAVAPDSIGAIAAVLSKYGAAGASDAKDSKVANVQSNDDVASRLWDTSFNPLDFPTNGLAEPPIGPPQGSTPGGFGLLPAGPPPNTVPVSNPVTSDTSFEDSQID